MVQNYIAIILLIANLIISTATKLNDLKHLENTVSTLITKIDIITEKVSRIERILKDE